MEKKILIAGESWSSTTTHTKGFDSFVTTHYCEGVKWLQNALEKGGYKVVYMPNHVAAEKFPYTVQELQEYDLIIVSDIGTNTLLLSSEVFAQSIPKPNRCDAITEYVKAGGAFCMIGGYMTFSGIDGKGRWGTTSVQTVLPVELLNIDDRVEMPQGIAPNIIDPKHQVLKGLPEIWPEMLGYNKTKAKGEKVLATINGDPFISIGEYGKGRSAVFTSDCSPHWAPPEFCDWEYYNKFWQNLAAWLMER